MRDVDRPVKYKIYLSKDAIRDIEDIKKYSNGYQSIERKNVLAEYYQTDEKFK